MVSCVQPSLGILDSAPLTAGQQKRTKTIGCFGRSASPKWVQQLLQNPRAEDVSSAAARVNSATFIFTFQQKSIPVWHAATLSCQMWTSHWRQRCMKSELASLLPVAMTTATFGKCPPTWGNSQVSPGNQNGSFYLHRNMKRVDPRAPVLDPCPVPSWEASLSQGACGSGRVS